jgi:hypothetical protein
VLAENFNRTLVLPKFHCYLDETADCYADVLFDIDLLQSLTFYENSFLPNLFLRRNLSRCYIELSNKNKYGGLISKLQEVLVQVKYKHEAELESCDVIELIMPKMNTNGYHLSLIGLTDRQVASYASLVYC